MEDTARANRKPNGSQIDTGTPNGSTNGSEKASGKQSGSENGRPWRSGRQTGNKTETETEDATYLVPEVGITSLGFRAYRVKITLRYIGSSGFEGLSFPFTSPFPGLHRPLHVVRCFPTFSQ